MTTDAYQEHINRIRAKSKGEPEELFARLELSEQDCRVILDVFYLATTRLNIGQADRNKLTAIEGKIEKALTRARSGDPFSEPVT